MDVADNKILGGGGGSRTRAGVDSEQVAYFKKGQKGQERPKGKSTVHKLFENRVCNVMVWLCPLNQRE
jgi:hypothetical protein